MEHKITLDSWELTRLQIAMVEHEENLKAETHELDRTQVDLDALAETQSILEKIFQARRV